MSEVLTHEKSNVEAPMVAVEQIATEGVQELTVAEQDTLAAMEQQLGEVETSSEKTAEEVDAEFAEIVENAPEVITPSETVMAKPRWESEGILSGGRKR